MKHVFKAKDRSGSVDVLPVSLVEYSKRPLQRQGDGCVRFDSYPPNNPQYLQYSMFSKYKVM
jgi:hypothetical protein